MLLNPRFPALERERLEQLAARLPRLERHVWLATSGVSGLVKLVALSREALLASAAAVNRHLEATARDTWVNVLPLFHVGGLGMVARAHLSGARMVGDHDAAGWPGTWSARAFARRVAAERATLSALVPAQVDDLVRERLPAPPSLRAVVVGGGAVPAALHGRARVLGWPLLPSYGATELCSQIATAPLASLDSDAPPPLALLSHIEAEVAAGGFLRFRSAALFTGYARPDAGDESRGALHDPKVDGWWTSEDRGELGGGCLVVEGRGADFLKIGGESTSLGRLEAVLADARRACAFDADATLLAMADDRLGHAVVLLHDAPSDAPAAALVAAFNARVLPFERIRSIHRLASLPRSPLGKLLPAEARRRLGRP
ncbi:MAG: AMP-binding protein [Planctomycetes bacterium]|nr:AMP-binding protein [Planctomycetota bacterium]